jgi:hypothetical protein
MMRCHLFEMWDEQNKFLQGVFADFEGLAHMRVHSIGLQRGHEGQSPAGGRVCGFTIRLSLRMTSRTVDDRAHSVRLTVMGLGTQDLAATVIDLALVVTLPCRAGSCPSTREAATAPSGRAKRRRYVQTRTSKQGVRKASQ